MPLILCLENISFGFPLGRQVFNSLSLELEKGKIFALIGTNGSGKTTLFNLLTGFHKVSSGKIYFKYKDITNKSPFRINRLGIGRTFQDLRIIAKLTVKENIILAMQHNPTDNWLSAILPENFHRGSNWDFDKKAEKIIQQFFLANVKKSLAAEISYGQQKLLSFACCVANGATLLLLDEVVAGIQPEYRNKIAILIKQLKEQGITILFIEHNTDFIAEVADKIFFLHEGKISQFENMEVLRKDMQVIEAYI